MVRCVLSVVCCWLFVVLVFVVCCLLYVMCWLCVVVCRCDCLLCVVRCAFPLFVGQCVFGRLYNCVVFVL